MLRTLLTIRQKSLEPSFREVMNSCFISMCEFGSFKKRFSMISCLYELYLRFRKFILLIETNIVISMNYGSNTSNLKPWRWVRLDLTLAKFISSSRNTEFNDIFSWKISQMIMKTIPISTTLVKSYAMIQGISFWVWWKVNRNWDNHMIRIYHWSESHSRTSTSIRRKK